MPFDIWNDFTNLLSYAKEAFSLLDIWLYPLIFAGFIGYVYTAMQSITVAIVAILITFGLYATTTNIFVDVPDLSLFFYVVSLLGLSLLVATLFIKRWNQ